MKNLKFSIITLILGLALFLSIPRLDLGQVQTIRFEDFVYVLAIVAVVAIISAPILTKISITYTLAVVLTVYIVLKTLVFNTLPFFGGIYSFVTITEMGMIGVMVALAYQVGRGVQEFLHSVEVVTLAAGGSKRPRMAEAVDQINAEMNRSRHYNRSLSIILAELSSDEFNGALPPLLAEAQQRFMRSYVTARLADTIRKELRRMDLVLEDLPNGRVIIVSPEVDDHGSSVLQERLSKAVNKRLGIGVHYGAASYPEMALTFEGLIQEAEIKMQPDRHLKLGDNPGVAD